MRDLRLKRWVCGGREGKRSFRYLGAGRGKDNKEFQFGLCEASAVC